MPDPDPPEWEIDQGEPAPTRAAPPAAMPITAAEQAEDERLRVAVPAIRARMQEAERERRLVDMLALLLAFCCGQGIAGATRIDAWNGGATLGLLAAIAGIFACGGMWWRTRQPAIAIEYRPILLDEQQAGASHDPEKRAAARRRCAEEIATVEMLATDLEHHRARLRAAVWGAAGGTLCGWLVGATAPAGVAGLAASAAALPGAVLGWLVAHGGWPVGRIQGAVIGGLPGIALVTGLLAGAGWIPALIGAAIAVAAGVAGRARIPRLLGQAPAEDTPVQG